MIRFFDPHASGNDQMIYNGDLPYIHWAEPFSTGVIRYKSIFFISDKSSVTVTMNLNQNPFTGSVLDWVFALYNPGHVDSEMYAIDWNLFCDLHAVATNRVTLTGQSVKMDGANVYAYQLIIICKSDVEGEFVDDFWIDGNPYKVGAEFYGENEALKINLANQGTEIPDMVCKAIYGSDLYESNVDWVLLNRKLRELMTCHLDIMDNKGSYKSLLNALKWFEYDNLVELREVWKFETPDGTKYFERPVKMMMDEKIQDLLFNSAKTTYFTLRHLKRDIVGHNATSAIYSDTTYDYDPDSNNAIKRIACKWSEDEMKLKMVLLGNFFETYFMPVHADLIRSCVEDITDYTFELELSTGECVHEMPAPDKTFDFSWDGDEESGTDPYAIHKISLDEAHAYAGLTQSNPYGQAFENNGPALMRSNAFVPMIACHTMDEHTPGTSDDSTQIMAGMLGQVYNGIGAIETAHFVFDEPIVSGTCISNQWGEFIETSFSGITKPADYFDVKFIFPQPGDFEFHFDFVGKSGRHYTKTVNVSVEDNLRVKLMFYKLRTKPDRLYKTIDPFTAKSEFANMMSIDRDMKFDIVDGSNNYEVRSLEVEPNYMRFMPIRKYPDTTPSDAPCTTKVRTIQWAGPGATEKMNAFNVDSNYWCQRGSNKDLIEAGEIPASEESAYIRICSKKRDGSPQNIPQGNGYTVYDHDVFFPELHQLAPIDHCERIPPYYPIVCVPELHLDGDESRRVNYSLLADEPIWEFYSCGAQRVVESFNKAISTPAMLNVINDDLPVGMYRITFNYMFGNVKRSVTAYPDWIITK